jgi:hypothetical protein
VACAPPRDANAASRQVQTNERLEVGLTPPAESACSRSALRPRPGS